MAFFLGISIVSVLECICYCCKSIGDKCCSGETENEAEEREKWQAGMNFENEIEDKGVLILEDNLSVFVSKTLLFSHRFYE